MAEPTTVTTGLGYDLAVPPPAAVDLAALERDATRVRQLIALWRKQEEDVEIEAEDEYLLMMS